VRLPWISNIPVCNFCCSLYAMLAFFSCVCCCCIITVYCFVIAVLLPLINWLINWYVLSQDIRLSPPSFFVGKFRMLLRVDKSLAGFGLIATFVQETGRGLVMATVMSQFWQLFSQPITRTFPRIMKRWARKQDVSSNM